MTLKEELEILRGEPIEVFNGDPMAIPCIETSDAERLCKHPVVSVHMITYNHESYIRQAIEGVMIQKADFEFELVIGEDCSQDKTREICFEYQKKYPDKIRVLWWHENVTRYGGNGRRVTAHCRGEFIAFCEGDDYWIDPLKLQKQVDVMRKYPNVGLCFCGAKLYNQLSGKMDDWICSAFSSGVISGRKFSLLTIFGRDPLKGRGNEGFVMTAGLLARSSAWNVANKYFEICNWMLRVGDTTICLGCSSVSDVYYLPDQVSVYRITQTGAMGSNGIRVCLDSSVVRLFFARRVLDLRYGDIPTAFLQKHFSYIIQECVKLPWAAQIGKMLRIIKVRGLRRMLLSVPFLPMLVVGLSGMITKFTVRGIHAWWYRIPKHKLSENLRRYYKGAFDK